MHATNMGRSEIMNRASSPISPTAKTALIRAVDAATKTIGSPNASHDAPDRGLRMIRQPAKPSKTSVANPPNHTSGR